VALDVELVTHPSWEAFSSKEMVHANFPDIANGCKRANVTANACRAFVAVTHHDCCVPSNQIRDTVLHRQVARVLRLQLGGNCVAHRRCDGRRDFDSLANCLIHQFMHQEPSAGRTVVLNDGIQRFNPLVSFLGIEARQN